MRLTGNIVLQPFQLWKSFGYVTIPITAIAVSPNILLLTIVLMDLQAFFFFGFLAAGEEIERKSFDTTR